MKAMNKRTHAGVTKDYLDLAKACFKMAKKFDGDIGSITDGNQIFVTLGTCETAPLLQSIQIPGSM